MVNRYEKFTCKEQHLTISCFIEQICPLIALKDKDGQFEPRKLYGSQITKETYTEDNTWKVSSIDLDEINSRATITI